MNKSFNISSCISILIISISMIACQSDTSTIKNPAPVSSKEEVISNEKATKEAPKTRSEKEEPDKCGGWLFRYGSIMGDVLAGKEGAEKKLTRLLNNPVYQECKDKPDFKKELQEINALRKK